jgi:hypothetical protein
MAKYALMDDERNENILIQLITELITVYNLEIEDINKTPGSV